MIDPVYYSINLSPLAWTLTGISVACVLLLIFIWAWRARRIWRQAAADNSPSMPADEAFPAVSVVVLARGDSRNLATLLPAILHQDYPAPFEVIVVNNEESASTTDVVGALQLSHSNLYMTYVPEHARSLSRRKLSITLGIKAARHPFVALTEGACRIPSPLWLKNMMRHAAMGKELVIGFATDVDEPDSTDHNQRRGAKLRNFDRLWNAVRWLPRAISHRPYRGTGANLVYSSDLFFKHKGFSSTLNMVYGDDDLFVHEIATRSNCAVELSNDSRIILPRTLPRYMHGIERQIRAFTRHDLPAIPWLVMGFSSLLWWLWLATSVTAAIIALPSYVPLATVILAAVPLWICSCRQWSRAAKALGLRPMLLMVPLMALWHPFYNIRYRIAAQRNRKNKFTNRA